MPQIFIDGNEAIARGALHAGCRFFAGYPITPATTISQHMLQLLPPLGGVCLQGEDEIASIGFCLGAAMAGVKAMTATSGPGISLYSEQLSFAIGGEIPLVIVDVQRLGPSTGSATKGADGDIQFLRWGNSGGLPVIVLAPVDAGDCYRLTVHAFNLAEKYRCPVFIASNKEIGLTRESVDLAAIPLPAIATRAGCPPDHSGRPFEPLPDQLVPPFLPLGGARLSRQTSSTHGEDGYITTDTATIARSIARLQAKLSALEGAGVEGAGVDLVEADCRPGDRDLLLVYGVTARAARTALAQLRQEGERISLLVVRLLYPVPEALLRHYFAGKRRIVVVEMNTGQYVREIERLAGPVPVVWFGRMDGELIDPPTITAWVRA